MYERLFRKSSIFNPGSNVPVMLPGEFTDLNDTTFTDLYVIYNQMCFDLSIGLAGD